MAKTSANAAPKQQIVKESRQNMPLTGLNFILMAVCGLLIVVGFLLMAGGSTTGDAFNPDIFSTRRIVVGPAIAFLGFLLMVPAIMYRNRKTDK